MATKDDRPSNGPRLKNDRGLNRRDFVKTGVAAGLGAGGALLKPAEARAQVPASGSEQTWDYEADVVIAGGGCAGLTAAIRARDLAASVLVVDQNFDLGGRMLHSGSRVSLGGGDPVQLRDMRGGSDDEGLITVEPPEDPEELDDNIELLFTDLTDWSVVDPKGQNPYRYNERELAREKGVEFMLHRRFDEIVREEPFAGRALGIKAHHSPRQHPETGELLQSFWRNGNIDERRETVSIRARQAVILASGGHAGNPEVRSMFYPALREPAFPTSGLALQGPHGQDASALIAGVRVGANLAGMQQNVSYGTTFHITTRLGTRDAYTSMMPGHPTFGFRGSAGINVGNAGFEEFIAVNQVGKRFFSEVRLPARPGLNGYPGDGGAPGQGIEHKPLDWRKCRKEWVREMYDYDHGLDAALALNEGSKPPDYYSGPLWAVFDQDAVERTGWELHYPYVSDNGYFFRADTIEDLAERVYAGHEFQRVPLSSLAETVAAWNSYVDAGEDPEFERHADAPMSPIARPPFYALSILVIWHDSYGGLRVNGRQQVVDMQGQVIPGLYAGGEAVGGFNKHGLGKGHVHGYIAGTHAVQEPSI